MSIADVNYSSRRRNDIGVHAGLRLDFESRRRASLRKAEIIANNATDIID